MSNLAIYLKELNFMLSITQTSEKIIVCKCGNDYLQTPMPNLQYYNSTFFYFIL